MIEVQRVPSVDPFVVYGYNTPLVVGLLVDIIRQRLDH